MTVWLAVMACSPPPIEVVDSGTSDTGSDTAVDTADTGVAAPVPWPEHLSETGLYQDVAARTLADGVRPFSPAFPLWSDGADKDRFIALPEGTSIDATDADHWVFPVGTRAWKTFRVGGEAIETRYIERGSDGWIWVAYAWRPDGSDADAVPQGVRDAAGTTHDIPDTAACEDCHEALGLVGVGALQLGDDNANATLDAWTVDGWIEPIITANTAIPGNEVERAALGYMHANCGSCHIDGTLAGDKVALRMHGTVGAGSPQDWPVYQTAIGAPTHHVLQTSISVVPGDPDASQVAERMAQRGFLQMPPIGTEVVDQDGVAAVRAWISGLQTP